MDMFAVYAVIATVIVIFLLNTFVNVVYQPFSCTFNQFECGGCGEFDGNCTSAVTSACCIEVRHCEGLSFTDPTKCLDRYCTTSGQMCVPVLNEENIAAITYDCKCESVSGEIVACI